MEDKTYTASGEARVKVAMQWLRTSQIDYDSYRKLVRCTWFPLVKHKPADPQPAVVSLQRSVEKLIKAVAWASGQYSYGDIVDKGHDSLGLCLDIHMKLMEAPVAKLFLDSVQGQIFQQSDARLFSQDESLRRLNELRTKARPGGARKEMGEWAYELSTLPQEPVAQLVKSQLRAIRSARIGAAILNRIPFGLYSRCGHSSGELSETVLRAFEKRGFLLSDGIRAFFGNEQVSSFFRSQPEERRMMLIKNLGNLLVFGTVSTAMVVLAALTFGHAVFPGYPGDPAESEKGIRKLESKSYQAPIGIASSILDVGELAGSVLKQSARQVEFYAEIFDFINSDVGGPFRPCSMSD